MITGSCYEIHAVYAIHWTHVTCAISYAAPFDYYAAHVTTYVAHMTTYAEYM